jgi:FkbM family methyltransferase
VLPDRVRRHPTIVRYARRVGVVEAVLPNGRVLRVRSRGDDDIAGPLFWLGWAGHEPETAGLFFDLAGASRVTLDIGAHVGYFALLAALASPDGRVYAFEPLARVRERLEGNVALNSAGNVTCLGVALGSPGGTAEFFHGDDRMPSSSSLSERFMQSVVSGQALTSTTVVVVEADDFIESHALGRVDLVKIDTETTEPEVIRGMLRTLRRDQPQIICEVLDAEVGAAIEALLEPLGYDFFLLMASGPAPRSHITPDARWRNYLFRVPRGAGPAAGER